MIPRKAKGPSLRINRHILYISTDTPRTRGPNGLVPKPNGDRRFTLDFVRLKSETSGLESWSVPIIQQTLSRVGILRQS